MTRNAELAYQVLDHILAHPEMHDQGDWFRRTECGTVACFAGWATLLSGLSFAPGSIIVEHAPDHLLRLREMSVGRAAARLLGLPDPHWTATEDGNEADDLFHPGNDREDLAERVEKYFGPRPVATS